MRHVDEYPYLSHEELPTPSEQEFETALECAGDCDPDAIVNEQGLVVGLVFFDKEAVKKQLEAGAQAAP